MHYYVNHDGQPIAYTPIPSGSATPFAIRVHGLRTTANYWVGGSGTVYRDAEPVGLDPAVCYAVAYAAAAQREFSADVSQPDEDGYCTIRVTGPGGYTATHSVRCDMAHQWAAQEIACLQEVAA